MPRRHVGKLQPPADEKYILADKEGVGPLSHKSRECVIDFTAGTGVEDLDLQSDGAGSRFQVSQRRLRIQNVGRIDEHGHTSRPGHQFTQEFQPLRRQLIAEKIDPRQIAARPIEAGDEAQPDRVFAGAKDDRDRRRCRLGCERRGGTSGRNDYGYLAGNQLGRQLRQPVELTLSPAIFDRHVLALDIAGVLEALAECAHTVRKRIGRCTAEEPDHRHCRLLRARCERPRRRAAEKGNELATLHIRVHSITSSASCWRCKGTSTPSAFAVFRLIPTAMLGGRGPGRSGGFTPLRMRSTWPPARRNRSTRSTPYDIRPPSTTMNWYGEMAGNLFWAASAMIRSR